jgi:hypothetical protein
MLTHSYPHTSCASESKAKQSGTRENDGQRRQQSGKGRIGSSRPAGMSVYHFVPVCVCAHTHSCLHTSCALGSKAKQSNTQVDRGKRLWARLLGGLREQQLQMGDTVLNAQNSVQSKAKEERSQIAAPNDAADGVLRRRIGSIRPVGVCVCVSVCVCNCLYANMHACACASARVFVCVCVPAAPPQSIDL